MAYVDAFMAPVHPDRREDYRKMAAAMAPIFLEHGATRIVECFSDDVPHGTLTDMYRAVAAEGEEGVVFSWIAWPSKEARDKGMPAVMADPRMGRPENLPFDGKRIIFGGFAVLMDTDDRTECQEETTA